ncbi:MAG: dockerin type I domain-containing protein [Phycisphaerales bacterium]|nr:dockerin type I domain-containing protein [Phycisphaerales bacterium]MCI0675527.1 dockerin type I domain-containing protein [Phycisphaerales bacterium]
MRAGSRIVATGLAGVCTALFLGQSASGQCPLGTSVSCSANSAGNQDTICCQPGGPDVVVGHLDGQVNSTAQEVPIGSGNWFDAFTFGTTSCNIGNLNLQWCQFPNNLHPAIGQSVFKVKDGRIEQLGVNWLKHGFTALSGNICGCWGGAGSCQGPSGSVLGVGCSDPYTASRNASQSNLGPRWRVNADTGFFPTGPAPNGGSVPASWSCAGSNLGRLIRVRSTDLEASSATVQFYGEAQYVAQDDAIANNQNNNTSYRRLAMSGGPNNFTGTLTGITQREQAGIRAWKDFGLPDGPDAGTDPDPDPNVVETEIQLVGEGFFILAAKATDLGGGQWHYEYALQNVNSDRSGQAFNVPLPEGAAISNIGFHDIEYHSGDAQGNTSSCTTNFDGTDWPVTQTSTSIEWATQTFAQSNNANALRWGTMYNYRYDADLPPQTGEITLTTYKVVGTVNALTVVPGADCNDNNVADSIDISNGTSEDVNGDGVPDECAPPECPGDLDGSGNVDVTDLLALIAVWGAPGGPADLNGDAVVNIADLLLLIGAWGVCP